MPPARRRRTRRGGNSRWYISLWLESSVKGRARRSARNGMCLLLKRLTAPTSSMSSVRVNTVCFASLPDDMLHRTESNHRRPPSGRRMIKRGRGGVEREQRHPRALLVQLRVQALAPTSGLSLEKEETRAEAPTSGLPRLLEGEVVELHPSRGPRLKPLPLEDVDLLPRLPMHHCDAQHVGKQDK
jgi:hypothetical protein